jgi:hypothetical protein
MFVMYRHVLCSKNLNSLESPFLAKIKIYCYEYIEFAVISISDGSRVTNVKTCS